MKLWTWVDALLKLSGLLLATPHSIRASACIWALRCYIDPDYVKEGGRWVGTGKSWRKYFQQGSAAKLRYGKEGNDPVFQWWVWKFNVQPDYDA